MLESLSGRIFATLAAVLSALLLAAAVFGELEIRAFHMREIEVRLTNACDLLLPQATDVLAGRSDRAAFVARIKDLGRATHLRLTVVEPDGSVIADSEAEMPLSSHAGRPEIEAALATGSGSSERRSATTGKITHYRSRAVAEGGRTLGTVRAAAEIEEIESAIGTLRRSLLLGGVVALAVGLFSSAVLARWLARPLEQIGRQAETVSSGDLAERIRADGTREVRRLAATLNAMADELRQRLASDRRARIEVETILASMAEGVVAVDESERVLSMNAAAARLLGLAAPLAPGARLWEELRFPELESALRATLAGGGASHGDARTPHGDGRTLVLSVATVGGRGSSTPFEGAVALLSDVTAIRRLEQMRIDFVANVSHELRTPLAAVMGALETLTDPHQDASTRARFLDIANRNAARLQAIVADLLDLSTIEAEGDQMPLEPTRIDVPLRAAAGALALAAESKGVRLEIPAVPGVPPIVGGNAQRLEQVFTNLLENAIKYTPGGGTVRARIRATAESVSVDVEDTGIGIPAASLARVFERFYRVDRSRSREGGGTGLGLAIVKHVVRAHGGRVEVRSVEGRGSTFTVTLPRAADRDAESAG